MYGAAARALGTRLAQLGLGLVYGGGNVGLMGMVADAALAAGGEAHGVIPEHLESKELAHRGLTRLSVVKSMHERKALMADLADAFVALPGGLGTLEELAEVATWTQLGLQYKPVGLLNVEGYYDSLLVFLDGAVIERFIRPEHRALLVMEREVDAMLAALTAWKPTHSDKWLDRSER